MFLMDYCGYKYTTTPLATQRSLLGEMFGNMFLAESSETETATFFLFLKKKQLHFLVPSLRTECILAGSHKKTCPLPVRVISWSPKDLGSFTLAPV